MTNCEFRVTDLKQFVYCPRIPFYQHVMGFHGKPTYKMGQGRVAQDAIESLEKRRLVKIWFASIDRPFWTSRHWVEWLFPDPKDPAGCN